MLRRLGIPAGVVRSSAAHHDMSGTWQGDQLGRIPSISASKMHESNGVYLPARYSALPPALGESFPNRLGILRAHPLDEPPEMEQMVQWEHPAPWQLPQGLMPSIEASWGACEARHR
mmetsp:Transcript_38828/g.89818  ORF Transcript_38828/g.89818 Transcript_38828/m.89818 type:complete len:117 (-) Transcript_38828:706-1056(-)